MTQHYEKHTNLICQYLENKEQCLDAFMFFRIGDFYEFFFDDAIHASKLLDIKLTKKSSHGSAPMCGVPVAQLDLYVAKLVNMGYKVAVCEQVEDPSLVAGKNLVKREIVKVVTPGTVTADNALVQENHNYIVSVSKPFDTFGLAVCELTTGDFYVTEVVDDMDKLLSELSAYAPKEVVIDDSIKNCRGLVKTLKKTLNPVISHVDSKVNFVEYLQSMLQQIPSCSHTAKHAAGMLYRYLTQTQPNAVDNINRLQYYQPADYMILDMNARKHLELVESVNGERKGSLAWAIDMTETPMGARLLKYYINRPSVNRTVIEQRLDCVDYLVANPQIRQNIRNILTHISDLGRLIGKARMGTANARDLVKIAAALECTPQIKSILEQSKVKLFEDMCKDIQDTLHLVRLIKAAIVPDPPITIKEGGVIREGYNKELDEYRQINESGTQWIAQYQLQLQKETGIKSLKIKHAKNLGYYIEISRAHADLIPPHFERKQELTSVCRYVTKDLIERENMMARAADSIYDLEYNLFVEVRNQVVNHADAIKKIANILAQVDVLQSFAELSARYNYVRPEICDDHQQLVIENGRHPVVEQGLVTKESYVPNDTLFNHNQKIVMITGPNMAGKSTYMRQVALICLLAHLGSHVPASFARIPIIDRIFTRIGASDNLYMGDSTFMVEMKDIKVICDEATEKSLVIVDELGRGTSVTDGKAIAQAVIEHLHDNVQCKTLVSTHYYELASLDQKLHSLKNYNMQVIEDGEQVKFMHKLVPGAASSSYGIYCAELAGISQHIIQRAKQLADSKTTLTHTPSLFPNVQMVPTVIPSNNDKTNNYADLIEQIADLDVSNMTPVEALVFLHNIKNKLKSR